MASRKYDIVVFGATGFTGQYTVEELSRVAEEEGLQWAVSGRNMAKIQKVLSEISRRSGQQLENVPIIIADTSNSESLVEMAAQTKVVLNCVGPYVLYGEPVVKACIEAGTHHLDVSGETQYLEKMQLMYHEKARKNGVFIIGSVAFDSIPTDMGVLYTLKQFGEGELTNVEAIFNTQHGPEGGALNTGTLESGLYVISHTSELKSLRKSLFPEPLPKLDYCLPRRLPLAFSKETNKWLLPFPGSDEPVVNRTMRKLLETGKLEKPIELVTYFGFRGFTNAVKLMFLFMMLSLLAFFEMGCKILLKYPDAISFGLFKSEGPSQKQIDESTFTVELVGYGFSKESKERGSRKPDKIVQTKVSGPDYAYGSTPICAVQCAVTLLKDRDNIKHEGGVLTPGGAFIDTNLIERLCKHNVKFTTIK